MGSNYPRRDRSFILGNLILRSINSHWHLISRLQFIAPGPLAIWLAESFATPVVQGQPMEYIWGPPTIIASFTLSIAVNALVTGLIVFKILGVFLEVKAATTSVERTLGKAWAGTKLRHVVFVIIESGMGGVACRPTCSPHFLHPAVFQLCSKYRLCNAHKYQRNA